MGWEPGAVIFAGKDFFVRPPLRRVEGCSANPANLRWTAGGGAAGVIFGGKDFFVRPPLRRVEVSSANPGNLRWPAGGGAAGLVKAQRVQVERAGEGGQETDGVLGLA